MFVIAITLFYYTKKLILLFIMCIMFRAHISLLSADLFYYYFYGLNNANALSDSFKSLRLFNIVLKTIHNYTPYLIYILETFVVV